MGSLGPCVWGTGGSGHTRSSRNKRYREVVERPVGWMQSGPYGQGDAGRTYKLGQIQEQEEAKWDTLPPVVPIGGTGE